MYIYIYKYNLSNVYTIYILYGYVCVNVLFEYDTAYSNT